MNVCVTLLDNRNNSTVLCKEDGTMKRLNKKATQTTRRVEMTTRTAIAGCEPWESGAQGRE
jgi:hypothetical protein